MKAEGWYRDPYQVHEDRWYSVGEPTSLVRDDGVVDPDAPPPGRKRPPTQESEQASRPDGSDLRRADEAAAEDQTFDNAKAVDAALGAFTLGTSFNWIRRPWRRS
jgi:hypothetical protein